MSAQAFKYWLRNTLETRVPGWQAAPIFREGKVAYTDANPIRYWDDDLFGYMRAPSKKADAGVKERIGETELTSGVTLTRAAPFRVSTLVSLSAGVVTQDFGVMSRHEGDPVPYEHEFYRATLKGLFSLNLRECGRFSEVHRTGFLHLDANRVQEAQEMGLAHDEVHKSYSLSAQDRIQRITALFDGMSQMEGGAKQAQHYTDVAPPFVAFAVTKGGNHIFNYLVDGAADAQPVIRAERLTSILDSWRDTLLAGPYIGWAPGYQEAQREAFAAAVTDIPLESPRQAFQRFSSDLQSKGMDWFAA